MKKLQIAVIGSAGAEEYDFEKPTTAMFEEAEKVGALLARADCIVVNGGKGGVMEAVCKGAKSAGGLTVAEIAGNGRGESNPYVDVEMITTDVGFRGPSALIGMSDVVISVGGGAGTLQEIAVAYRMRKPIVLLTGFGGWTDRLEGEYLDERRLTSFVRQTTAAEAVAAALQLAQEQVRTRQ